MRRRHFLKQTAFAAAGFIAPRSRSRTEHLILIVPSGVRKKDYYEDASTSPHIAQLARKAFVFEQDHCERVASHDVAFQELVQSLVDATRDGVVVNSTRSIPSMLANHGPRLIVCRDMSHDIGHDSFAQYLHTVKTMDADIGSVVDWLKHHPEFSRNTAIVIRPDFGRDDELNAHGQLHHSYGFYYTHRVASIFWGPDFNQGVEKRTVIHSSDLAPTLAAVLAVQLREARGRILSELFSGSWTSGRG